MWVAPRRAAGSVADLDAGERADFARALKTVLLKFDGLWGKPFPYIMVFHQAPTDGEPHPEAHLHVEIYPGLPHAGTPEVPRRQRDSAPACSPPTRCPEEKAAELQAVEVALE